MVFLSRRAELGVGRASHFGVVGKEMLEHERGFVVGPVRSSECPLLPCPELAPR